MRSFPADAHAKRGGAKLRLPEEEGKQARTSEDPRSG
jgi:hypothetical protein